MKIVNLRDAVGLLRNEQFGFRPGLSSNFQLLRLTEELLNALRLRHFTGAVFMDYAQAFGSVWHDDLLIRTW